MKQKSSAMFLYARNKFNMITSMYAEKFFQYYVNTIYCTAIVVQYYYSQHYI